MSNTESGIAQLRSMARESAAHAEAGTLPLADSIVEIASEHYYDEQRWKLEMDRVFRRIPLMLAATCELPNPGDYKSTTAVGLPIIISRTEDGSVRAFANICAHRGAVVMPEGCGNTHRFTCPYHAWSYNPEGELTGVFSAKDFGDLDKSKLGLRPLPVLERSGLIWVIPNPDAELDIANFLSGYDAVLDQFNFAGWHMFSQRRVDGPNWKIAYDGYLDLYHLPILHKDTFGSDFPHRAMYHSWGPHQRASSPDPSLVPLMQKSEEEWPDSSLLTGVWTIFPHVSIASFDGGGRGVMLSQLFPGETPQESYTIQNYMMEKPPSEEQEAAATEQFELLKYVVETEDYATGLLQQQALMTGARKTVMFGRNEGGGQNFHRWLDRILSTEDADLDALFTSDES
ncbi:aromatic ring-hydroxylating dioxygenase subunit alpha [Halieaceae bacterium IMCC14734]|uniref:Aromatic ring-hydroxylating dioxygenase subunit alpha n=1 Tax=Candidatus Litorirhabdus singularis TaxID=2518993 RepID=A0ABT3TDR2_9GAMM|nr:aromatic ring-hydroxylating dioxygenase subunit alpha [Candidatus Litorirhabdus singularis]MCX2980394.1 aromatic ring-hydroxylating dioxygenase subunit alpha [Candidatus Litorirhabdus singularis]